MKSLVALYHNNPHSIYESQWIDQCLNSIEEQTIKDFDVFELAYGPNPDGLWGNRGRKNSSLTSVSMPSFVDAINSILDYADGNYDVVFNVHLDDWYASNRFERQLTAIEQGFDIVSSNFVAVNENGVPVRTYEFDHLDINQELLRGHNILCNPVIAFGPRFLSTGIRYNPERCPEEDFACWLDNAETMKMVVLPDLLCYKRMHGNEISMRSGSGISIY